MQTWTGNHIYLREIAQTDWPAVYGYASQEIVCRYQAWEPITEQQAQAFVNHVLAEAQKQPRTRFVFAIVERATEQTVGTIELIIRSAVNKSGEIGYVVHPDYWGRGYATEAAALVVGYGFEECRLHRISATCDPRNRSSAKVLAKIGMTPEGTLREDLAMKGGWRDSLVFSLLEQEWSKGPKQAVERSAYMYRDAQQDDFVRIAAFPQNAQEQFYMYPSGTFPLDPERLHEVAQTRQLPTVILDEERVVGYCNTYKQDGHIWLGNVIVDPVYRGRGAATFLVQTMLHRVRTELGEDQLHLICHNTNTPAMQLYAKLGFHPYGWKQQNAAPVVGIKLRRDT